ncbi:ATPase [Cephaloticoccus primus]|uniref:ATPase n=1 Tax=Cephaloticoccus primus TaxID=1548207 RepID=A0A139SQU1_9BACT|nr:MoxR family ATPase [Cephaloticoccus primus]KXU36840.1 ATPase [Cephaloticoccus primus]
MLTGPTWSKKLRDEIAKTVIGQDAIIERLLVALLANGHVLLEGMPGLAKTLLVKSLGTALGVQFERVQFTPDLLPSDVVGTMVFQPKTGEFSAHRGPIFANLVLADEINRAPAKVQSALLEAMQEHQVTIGGGTHPLPRPFFVMATQNPVEQEGTYPLPEAQTDRFLLKLLVDYPSADEESAMMQRWGQVARQPELSPVSSGEELLALRPQVDAVHVAPAVQAYILSLVRATRALAGHADGQAGAAADDAPHKKGLRPLEFGASPRASLALYQAGKALACLRGQDFLTPALVQEIAPDVLRHRVGLTYEAEAEDITADALIAQIIERSPIPSEASR